MTGSRTHARLCILAVAALLAAFHPPAAAQTLSPLLRQGQPVDWWFVFKFNSSKFEGCGPDSGLRACPFGGRVQKYTFSQQFVYASKADGQLTKGRGCLGATTTDPVGATFEQVYNGAYHFVLWNDQFYNDPALKICGHGGHCPSPWGHSKGMLAWNDQGEGFVMQVTTPSWPGAGSKKHPRKVSSGNTLGCIGTNNNVKFSQHFFAVKLNKSDLVILLKALANASIVTDPRNPQIVRNGGPADIRELVDDLGKKSTSTKVTKEELSAGVTLISKPSRLEVPPWQMVSALLESQGNRSATWWAAPRIYSTTKKTKVRCWDDELKAPGASAVARTGSWDGEEIGLIGGSNHAKIGVTTTGSKHYAIFGDLNQQGTIAPPKCERSQNGRGGLFFVVEDKALFDGVTDLLDGDTAPTRAPKE